MSIKTKIKQSGLSLLEVMLAVLILTTIAVLALRMSGPKFREHQADHAAQQMQQIMEAATSYYIDNAKWPTLQQIPPHQTVTFAPLSADNITVLTGMSSGTKEGTYLPFSILNDDKELISPFGTPYLMGPSPGKPSDANNPGALYYEVQVDTNDPNTAITLKAQLPLAYISANKSGKETIVTSYVNIPSYDYNHAKTISNAGVYYPGDCIPQPAYACPHGMKPATFVTLEQGYGLATPLPQAGGQPGQPDDQTAYAITGFSAYTIAPQDEQPVANCPETEIPSFIIGKTIPNTQATIEPQCPVGQSRACVNIQTKNGQVMFDEQRLADTHVLAMTKCVPDYTDKVNLY